MNRIEGRSGRPSPRRGERRAIAARFAGPARSRTAHGASAEGSRTPGGRLPAGSVATPPRRAGGRRARDRPRGVGHLQIAAIDTSAIARSAGTVGGTIARGISTSSAASICSSWNRWRPASFELPTVSSSKSSALNRPGRRARRAGAPDRARRRQARHVVDAVDAGVYVVDALGGGVRLGDRAEGERVGEDQRAFEPLPGVALVEPGFPRPRDHQRVGGLHQTRSRASEEDGDLAVDLPADAARPEVAEIAVPWSCQPL